MSGKPLFSEGSTAAIQIEHVGSGAEVEKTERNPEIKEFLEELRGMQEEAFARWQIELARVFYSLEMEGKDPRKVSESEVTRRKNRNPDIARHDERLLVLEEVERKVFGIEMPEACEVDKEGYRETIPGRMTKYYYALKDGVLEAEDEIKRLAVVLESKPD